MIFKNNYLQDVLTYITVICKVRDILQMAGSMYNNHIRLSIMNDLIYYEVIFLCEFSLFSLFIYGAMTKGTICDSLSHPNNFLGRIRVG